MQIKDLYQIFLDSQGVSTDTRTLRKSQLFFALKGANFNGNKYAKQALEAGAKIALIDEAEFKENEQYILVNDVLETLQKLANWHRKQLKIPVIGITGSNGKTTTKELIHTVLSKKFRCYATEGNLNNHIGVPLTLLRLKKDTEIAIVEMGANHVGEIEQLSKIAEPDYGMITNIGKAHLEGFGSLEGVKKAKGELYDFIRESGGKLFVNGDLDYLVKMSENMDIVTYGKNSKWQISGTIAEHFPFIKIKVNNPEIEINSHLTGEYNFYNIMAAVCIGHYFEIDNNLIKEAIENYIPANNRSQVIKKGTNTIFLDAYNANPTSMRVAIENFSKVPDTSQRIVILGDMKELGKYSSEEHQKILELLESAGFTLCVLVGKEFKNTANGFEGIFFENVSELSEWLNKQKFSNSYILIKGSREMQLEKLLD